MVRITEFIGKLTEVTDAFIPTTYEEAPTSGSFPFAVISGVNIIDLSEGDMLSFNIDIYADETKPEASTDLENLCDTLRNNLDGLVVYVPGAFGAHIAFESQSSITEAEHDLMHRRLSMSARIFYN